MTIARFSFPIRLKWQDRLFWPVIQLRSPGNPSPGNPSSGTIRQVGGHANHSKFRSTQSLSAHYLAPELYRRWYNI